MESIRLRVPLGQPRLELLVRFRLAAFRGGLACLGLGDEFRATRLVLGFGLTLLLAQFRLGEDVVDDAADAPAFRLRNDECGLRIELSFSDFSLSPLFIPQSSIRNPQLFGRARGGVDDLFLETLLQRDDLEVLLGIARGVGFDHCRGEAPLREKFFVAAPACVRAIKVFKHAVEVAMAMPEFEARMNHRAERQIVVALQRYEFLQIPPFAGLAAVAEGGPHRIGSAHLLAHTAAPIRMWISECGLRNEQACRSFQSGFPFRIQNSAFRIWNVHGLLAILAGDIAGEDLCEVRADARLTYVRLEVDLMAPHS